MTDEERAKALALDLPTRSGLLKQARRGLQLGYPTIRLTWHDGTIIEVPPADWVRVLSEGLSG